MPGAKPLIVLIGPPSQSGWGTALLHRLELEYETVRFDDSAPLLDQLLTSYPALALVDSSRVQWIAVLKTDQATRRIPILVIVDHAADTASISAAGADGFIAFDMPEDTIWNIIRQHARVLSPETLDRLLCQCREELPPLARLGVERFNQGAYYAQHDAFEEQWMAENGPVRDLYRAILQVGVAYHHITRGNYAGGLRMFQRCVQWFALLPDECQGVDVRQLREDAARVRTLLGTITAHEITAFDPALLKPIRLIEPT